MTLIPWLLLLLPCPVSELSMPAAGECFATPHVQLIKKANPERSALYPGRTATAQEEEARLGEAQRALALLAEPLERWLTDSSQGLLRQAWLEPLLLPNGPETVEIDAAVPPPQLYAMYIAELHWPFPAPLLADLLRLRLHWATPQALRDLLTVRLCRFGQDELILGPPVKPTASDTTDALFAELQNADSQRNQWLVERAARALTQRHLTANQIKQLVGLAQQGLPKARVQALKVLGKVGFAPGFALFAQALGSTELEERRAGFWGLWFGAQPEGLQKLASYPERQRFLRDRLKEVMSTTTEADELRELALFDWWLAGALGATRPKEPPVARPLPRAAPPHDDDLNEPAEAEPLTTPSTR